MGDGLLVSLVFAAIVAAAALAYFVLIRPKLKAEEESQRKSKGRLLPEDAAAEVETLLQGKGITVDPSFHTGQSKRDAETVGANEDAAAAAATSRLSQGNGQPPVGF
jgi:hypothetical protein